MNLHANYVSTSVFGDGDYYPKAAYPLNGDILNSAALAMAYQKNGTFLLPQAYSEGCPQHPSYAQGHASIAGACATLLKAAFDGDAPFAALTNGEIVTASEDGLSPILARMRAKSQSTVKSISSRPTSG